MSQFLPKSNGLFQGALKYVIIQFNSYLFTPNFKWPEVSYKISTSKMKKEQQQTLNKLNKYKAVYIVIVILIILGVQSACWLDVHFTVGTSYERAAPLVEKMPPRAYQTSQYVVPRGGIFLGKWPSTFAGSSSGTMNVQSACALNTLYKSIVFSSCFEVLANSASHR
jgi:hypothetical protein